MNTPYIANSWQAPNFIADMLDYYLTPVETKVLYRLLREILGYKDQDGNIKLSNTITLTKLCEDVYSKRTGDLYSKGCGLSRQTVQKTLHGLAQLNIIRRGEKSPYGVKYGINFDTGSYDWEALEDRAIKRAEQGRQRIRTATERADRGEDGTWKS